MPEPEHLGHSRDDLIASAAAYADAWGLSDPVPLTRTTMGFIQRVTCADGSFAVLKCLSDIGRREEGTAPSVLKAFDGSGAVRILRSDDGAQLLEFCEGPQLLGVRNGHLDEVAVPILTDVVTRLRSKRHRRPANIPSLARRCTAIDRALDAVSGSPAILLRRARTIADRLLADERPALLHGDLHHENVLRCDRPDGPTWLAIDPQGIWGDPAYEVANLFGNPLHHPDVTLSKDRPARLAAALESALGLAGDRMLEWGFVHSCISAAWAIHDGADPAYRLRVADLIAATLE